MPPPWTSAPDVAVGVPAPRQGGGSAGATALSAAVWELDLTTGVLTWSEGMHRLVGSVPGQVVPSLTWWMSLVAEEDRARVRASLLVARETLRGGEEQFRMVGLDGVERSVHSWTEVEADAAGAPVRMFGSAVDVTGLARLGSRDPVTGLPGRTALQVHLGQAMSPPRAGRRVALLLVDLDRFSVLDDALGRAVGDALLLSAAVRLRALVPAGATVARLDGNTFAVLLPQDDGHTAEALAQQVLLASRRPHVLPDRVEQLTLTSSVGLAVADGDDPASAGTDAEDLLRHAGLALRRAKQDGRDRVVVHTPALTEAAQARVRSEAVLRSALDAGRLQVLYQPVVHLDTGEVAGVEALARIVDPELGPLSPALFVGVLEETGLVVRLDEWVLGRASAMAARWRPPACGAPGLPASGRGAALPTVAVNMSSRTLARPDLAGLVRGALRLSGTAPSRLLVELTEHSLLDQGPDARATLDGLQALGVGVGIDDFGTGWSALSYLSALDLSFMKIDRCFVSRLGTDASATAVVKAVIDLAHAHRLSVVAEGVETEDQARRLAAMGCDHGQGWWFGRPTAEADLDAVVGSWYQRAEAAGYGAWAPGASGARSGGEPARVLRLLG
jgi:diguanylate cyclase (GGDEF)-like protein